MKTIEVQAERNSPKWQFLFRQAGVHHLFRTYLALSLPLTPLDTIQAVRMGIRRKMMSLQLSEQYMKEHFKQDG